MERLTYEFEASTFQCCRRIASMIGYVVVAACDNYPGKLEVVGPKQPAWAIFANALSSLAEVLSLF